MNSASMLGFIMVHFGVQLTPLEALQAVSWATMLYSAAISPLVK